MTGGFVSRNDELLSDVADCLLRIERELRSLGEWRSEEPHPSALQSTQPFCIDTLEFTEWVQFVFISRMTVLVEQGQALPRVSGMAPMAEEHFRGRDQSGHGLIRVLQEMDQLLSDG